MPGIYEMNGKLYNEEEYQNFCEWVHSKNNNSVIWNETPSYKEDKIITLVPCPGCDLLK
jgi:hypothetical protein